MGLFDRKTRVSSSSSSATVVINGRSYSGRTVEIRHNKVFVDGKEADTEGIKNVIITVTGDLGSLHADNCEHVVVHGQVGSVKTMSGNVQCEAVAGDVETMSGNITCGAVAGGVQTMTGSIRQK